MERLLCDKIIYSQRIRDDLNNLGFKPHLYKHVRNFIFVTLILGGVFTWASASEPTKGSNGSNIYVFITERFPNTPYSVVLFSVIMILFFVYLLSFIPSMIAVRGELSIWKYEDEFCQKQLFIKFILSQIPELASEKDKYLEKILKLYDSKHQDIEFMKNDFYNFCSDYFKRYNAKIPLQFITDICELTLINELIDGTLVHDKIENLDRYFFVIEKNIEIFQCTY